VIMKKIKKGHVERMHIHRSPKLHCTIKPLNENRNQPRKGWIDDISRNRHHKHESHLPHKEEEEEEELDECISVTYINN
jgi:hypothetical protein